MAKAEKIYDIAEKLGYEGGTGGNTSDAINAVSDALGFVGPHARRITDALSDLYTVVSGGGGGGGDLGALQMFPMHSASAPIVTGLLPNAKLSTYSVSVGSSEVVRDFDRAPGNVAAGAVIGSLVAADKVDSIAFYSITPNSSFQQVETVTQLDIPVTEGETSEGYTLVSFTMPELNTEAFETLVVVYP